MTATRIRTEPLVGPPDTPIGPEAEIAALRGALRSETRIAEALAQRSRGLIDLVDALARRALREAADPREAEARLDALSRGMRAALAAGEAEAPTELGALAERTLAVFEWHEGPRIAIAGPEIELAPEAARLVGLVLFDLASASARRGALARPDGRAALDWELRPGAPLRLAWREFGAGGGAGPAPGGALLPLLAQRFGAPLKVETGPCGLTAELSVPAQELRRRPPARALLAVRQPALAAMLSALLYAGGLKEVRLSRGPAETNAVLAAERFDAVVVEASLAAEGAGAGRPRVVVIAPGAPEAPSGAVAVRLPATAEALAAAIARAREA